MNLTVTEVQAWLAKFSTAIVENKDYLSDLDTPIGDGDHGNNMARGVIAYEESVAKTTPKDISATFQALSMAMLSKVGGASGPLYGSAFMKMTKATKSVETITSYEQLGDILAEGLEGIKTRGKVELQDKTMIDVWDPVVKAMQVGELDYDMVETAKESTKDMVARKGRASYLGERSVGHIDPGATSSALLFKTLLEVVH
ncbi:dihydroxyacetone kinase subunit DhaL [Weissella sagaensis]|jgi:dihydroxyacetone kinase-like protein|uniref:dihydroxyacetone kinase subunit DhaL n=1 Tax=Weissella sagaensis TaxID=2559928 RepID=UPI0020BE1A16|nr:dihydroxyacetone kinase subunit DhaL [Weissella sagaensis]